MSNPSTGENEHQPQQQTPRRRPTISAAMARKFSSVHKNEQSSSPLRRVSVAFFKAQNAAKAKNNFLNLLRKDSSETSPSTPGLWDPNKEPRIVYLLKKERKSRKDAEFINEKVKKFAFYNQFIENNMTEFGDEAVLQLCKQMKYEFIPKGRYVMKEGDASDDKFYIILSGKASVVLKKEVNVYAQQNIEEMKKQDEEEQEQEQSRSPRRIRTSNNPKISKFAASRTDELEVPLNRDSDTIRPSLFKNAAVSRSTLNAIDNEPEINSESSLKLSKSPISSHGELTSFSQSEVVRKGTRKATLPGSKTDFLRRALGDSEHSGSATDFDLNEFGTVNKVLEQGSSFGEKALTNPGAKRTASIFTVTDCEFIIIYKKDFMTIINRFNKSNEHKLEFLLMTIPNLDKVNSRLILEDYMYSLHIADATKGQKITEQGKPGDRIYFIANGHCIIEKEVDNPNPNPDKNMLIKQKRMVQIARMGPNTIIGDELLFGNKKEKKYRYTAIVDSSGAKIYYMKANELQLKFPRDALQALKQNFQQKEQYHQKRIEFLLKNSEGNPNFYTEYSTLSIKNIFENLRPSSKSKTLLRAKRARDTERTQDVADQNETERLMSLRTQIFPFSRDPFNFRSQLQIRNNQTLEHYYLDLKASQQEITKTDSPKIFIDNRNLPADDSENEKGSSEGGTENPGKDEVFELTALMRENSKEVANSDSIAQPSPLALKKAPSFVRVPTEISESREQILNLSKETTDNDPQKPQRRRMGIRSADQLRAKLLKGGTLEIDTQKAPEPIKIHTNETERQNRPRAVKFQSLNDSTPLKSALPNETSAMLNHTQNIETELYSPKLGKHIKGRRLLRSASAKTTREFKRDISCHHGTTAVVQEPPNKRHYIIRQKENMKSDCDIEKNNKIKELKFEQVRDENLKSFGDDGLTKFNFGANRRTEIALEAKKKALLRRMLEQKGIIALEEKTTTVAQANLPSSRSFLPLNTLRALVTPRKDGFHEKIAEAVALTQSGKNPTSIKLPERATVSQNNINVKEIEVDTPMNIHSYRTTARNNGFGGHTRSSTITDTKSTTSASGWNSASQRRLVSERLSSGSKEPTTANSKIVNTSRETQFAFPTTDRRLHSSQERNSKSGADLSLSLKKNLHSALRANRKRTSWKENFGNTEDLSILTHTLSRDILEVKTWVCDRSQATQTGSHR